MLSYRCQNCNQAGYFVSFSLADREPGAENENLTVSSHQDNEDKEVLHAMQNMKEKDCEKEEGRTREDWDEVMFPTRFKPLNNNIYHVD